MGRGGGSKDPYLIKDGKYLGYVLLFLKTHYTVSIQMIENDIHISSIMTRMNLLNVQHKKVQISLDNENYVSSLISIHFNIYRDNLDNGIKGYVIGSKGQDLPKIKNFLFGTENDLFNNYNKWSELLSEFIDDAYKLKRMGFSLTGDSFNYIYLIYPDGRHRLRYFGFDFSRVGSKCKEPLKLTKFNDENMIPIVREEYSKYEHFIANARISNFIKYAVDNVMFLYYESVGVRKSYNEDDDINKILREIEIKPRLSWRGVGIFYAAMTTVWQ